MSCLIVRSKSCSKMAREKLLDELCDAAWNAPAELTELRVGGQQLLEHVNLANGNKFALRFASIGHWIDGIGYPIEGPQREGYEIGRILLDRRRR